MAVSVGIGLTNDCNLNCAHCYRMPGSTDCLSLDQIAALCERLDVTSFNLGTGENYLHPQFSEVVAFLAERGYKLSMASNGHSLLSMPEELLAAFHDVEVSIDFATPEEQDSFRGAGNWQTVMAAIRRTRQAGVQTTILATLMSTNYLQMDALATLARGLGANLRVNAYQPVQSADFTLSYDQFWEGYRRLFAVSGLVSTSEPVVNAVLGLDDLQGSPCGRESVRVTPRGDIVPCVYWPERDLTLAHLDDLNEAAILGSDLFRRARTVPAACGACRHVRSCGGGCASRRCLAGALDQPDPYCPYPRDDDIRLEYEAAPSKDLPRGRNVCTTIVI